ncbi:unnamed protein product [marine sediment metagenome]|uniref:Uncharacterized protein n=1 Tax=marine sediment metagenome TaxID=412755 RepID=X1TT30_9ZZZZ
MHNQSLDLDAVEKIFALQPTKQDILDAREAVGTYQKGEATSERYEILKATLEEFSFFSLEEFFDAESNQV